MFGSTYKELSNCRLEVLSLECFLSILWDVLFVKRCDQYKLFHFHQTTDIPCPPLTLGDLPSTLTYTWLMNDKRIEFECLEPYTPVNGTGQLDCVRNGTWLGSIPLCAGESVLHLLIKSSTFYTTVTQENGNYGVFCPSQISI